ncbi:MAG: hypothetical protein Tsb0013_06880 [Phycisphaerales bacterium]
MDSIIINAPWFSHVLAGAMMLLGVLMWLFGGRALRIAFTTFGAVAGALVAMTLPQDIATGTVRVLAILGGGLIGALLGGAAFRFTVAFTLAGVMMLVVPMLTADLMDRYGSPVATYDENTPLTDSQMMLEGVPFTDDFVDLGEIHDENREAYEARREASGGTPQSTTPETRWEVWLARCEDFLWALSDELKYEWDRLPPRDKSLLVIACLSGLVLGLALGLAAQKTAAVMLAAGAGGVLFLPSAVWLLTASKADTGWLPASAGAWVMVWIGLSAIGALTQRYLVQPRLKKSKPTGGEKSDD